MKINQYYALPFIGAIMSIVSMLAIDTVDYNRLIDEQTIIAGNIDVDNCSSITDEEKIFECIVISISQLSTAKSLMYHAKIRHMRNMKKTTSFLVLLMFVLLFNHYYVYRKKGL